MKPVTLILGAVTIILLFGAIVAAVFGFMTEDYSADYVIASGANSTSVTLTQDLFDNKTSNVVVSSNESSDAPIPSSYSSTTHTLTIIGLNTAVTHRLSLTYKIDRLSWAFGAGLAARTIPTFLIIGIIGIIAGAVYLSTRRGED